MNMILRITMALALTFGSAPAMALTVKQEVDVKVQQRIQKTRNGAPSARPEEYEDKPNGLVLDQYILDLESEIYMMGVEASHVGLTDQSISAEGGMPGKMSWKIGWDEMYHLFSNEARSPYQDVGEGRMLLNGGWRNPALTSGDNGFNAGISTALAGAAYVPLGYKVQTGNIDLRFHPSEHTELELGAWRQTRRGTKSQMAAFGFSNAIELATPIDQATNEAYFDVGLHEKDFQLALAYRLSDFHNNIPTITWDNPKRLTDQYNSSSLYSSGAGAATGRMAGAPDNRAHSFKLEGGVNLPKHTRISFESGYQLWKSLNPMLPYATNSSMTATNMWGQGTIPCAAMDYDCRPDKDVNGKIEVYTYMARLASRPLEWLRGSLTHEAYIMENKSKRVEMPGFGVFDNVWHAEDIVVTREQFREDKTALRADYDVNSWLSGDFGAARKYMKKTREIPKSKEYEFTKGFTLRPSRDLSVNLSYLLNLRRGNGMDLQHYPRTTSSATGVTYFTEHPGLRRPDVADRNRNQARVQTQWTPGESSFSLSARVTEDKYRLGKGHADGDHFAVTGTDLYGLKEAQSEAAGLEFSVPVIGSLTVDGFYEIDHSKRHLRSSQTACAGTTSGSTKGFGLPGEPACSSGTLAPYVMTGDVRTRWETRMVDWSNAAGLTLTARPTGRMKASVGYEIVATRTNADPIYAGEWVTSYRSLETSRRMLQTLRADTQYALTEALSVGLNYEYEKFDAHDFAYSDVPLRNVNDSIWLGASPLRNYYAHMGSVGLNYKF